MSGRCRHQLPRLPCHRCFFGSCCCHCCSHGLPQRFLAAAKYDFLLTFVDGVRSVNFYDFPGPIFSFAVSAWCSPPLTAALPAMAAACAASSAEMAEEGYASVVVM